MVIIRLCCVTNKRVAKKVHSPLHLTKAHSNQFTVFSHYDDGHTKYFDNIYLT